MGHKMKNFIIIFTLFISYSILAADKCKDLNFKGLELGENYDQLKYHNRFSLLFEADSPAPAGFSDYFGNGPELCFDVMATYLKHNFSGKSYLMYTTHDDYCDGGNTSGVILDMDLYSKHNLENAIVADISDSAVYCR
jgi:hypothetical protein